MTEPICWRDLPDFVPGRIGLCSDGQGWKNVGLRSYHYQGQDVIVPAMKDFMLVGYRAGVTPMQRRFDGRWTRETLSPGAASFLTRAQAAHWTWTEPVDVTHVYLSSALLNDVASEMYDRRVTEVSLGDVLRTDDPVVTHAMAALSAEAHQGGVGGALYVDALSRALVIHLLRNYATVRGGESRGSGTLSLNQRRKICEFIETNLSEALDLTMLSKALDMTPCLFARQFKASFEQPPYAYVMQRRVERARRLLANSDLAIKAIAADCGFSDQAHLTRLFRRAYDMPPSQYRLSLN
ncbi:helix-turn-helix domain-containing protein [Thetidibacter halocola]|uniref:Helix-turn-helix transcriptional regulator n=1 Tax=Thetidibacter halocola TaxID=2827239 RepID=A0A8J7WCD9_9RHOB|nr:AraC family transcriptional regulator [Thetidibacter halocola]MBS0125035.1 helix-turn-helix transcriptional regulator [Thetidibacter halocola]